MAPDISSASPKLKWRVASASGFLLATSTAGYPAGPFGSVPCDGLYDGYIGGTLNKPGYQQGGHYKGRVLKTSGSLSRSSGNGNLVARVKIPYEQAGNVVCGAGSSTNCDKSSATTTLDMVISVRGRKIYWDPGGDRPDLSGLRNRSVVPPFVCKADGGEARIDWQTPNSRTPCPARAPRLSSLKHKTTLVLKLSCKVIGKDIGNPGRPTYGFQASYPFTGKRTYFKIGDPVLAVHRATIKLVRRR